MLPPGTVQPEHALWFDINLAVKGLLAENAPTENKPKGKTTNKRQFLELAKRAKAEVAEMEEARTSNG